MPMLVNISSGMGTSRTVSRPFSLSKLGQSFLMEEEERKKKKKKKMMKMGSGWVGPVLPGGEGWGDRVRCLLS